MKNIRLAYEEIKNSNYDRKVFDKYCWKGFSDEEIAAYKRDGFAFYKGKVRDLLIKNDKILMVHSDRLSAFDKFISLVPYKGTILAMISDFWFKMAEGICPTHSVSSPKPNILEVRKLNPIKAEVIVRGYLAGSMARAYEAGERVFCGVKLPDGLKSFAKLPTPIITPTSKAEVFEHDENMTPEQIVKAGICSESEWEKVSEYALSLFSLGTEINEKLGWILVDTKYEFGKDSNGEVVLIDEVHTPDSSRFWVADSYRAGEVPKMLDKENVRRYLMDVGFKGDGKVPEVPLKVLLDLGEVYLSVAEKLLS